MEKLPERPKALTQDLCLAEDRTKEVLELFLEGLTHNQIAESLNLPKGEVAEILTSETAREALRRIWDLWDLEFRSLYPLATQAVKDGLQSENELARIRAARVFFGARKEMPPIQPTAEDVVRRIVMIYEEKDRR